MIYFPALDAWLGEAEIAKLYACYLEWHNSNLPGIPPVMITEMGTSHLRDHMCKCALAAGYGQARPEEVSANEPRHGWEPWIGKAMVWLGIAEWTEISTTQTR